MNYLDTALLEWINQFAQCSPVFDTTLYTITHSHLLKGGVLVALVWCLWFRKNKTQPENRTHILAIYISCIAAIALGRLAALILPFRSRPMHDESFYFFFPYGLDPGELGGWSSLPSDHAVLFFALSTGLVFISKRVGIFALLYTAVMIIFPRLYFGYHYPSDIAAGAVLGITIAVLSNTYLVQNIQFKTFVHWLYSKPFYLYAVFILFSFQITEMFDRCRPVIRLGMRWLGIIPS